MQSIPASQLVSVVPSVLGTGGNPLSLNAVFLTEDTSIPIGEAQAFASYQDVANWFGANAQESVLANVYFLGFTGANKLPGTLYFYQYNDAAVAAYLRSGSLAGVSLTTLQSYTGTLISSIDGRTVTSASINLSSATSFSNAAALLQTGLQTTGNVFNGTGTVTNTSTTLTINSTVSGQLHVGDTVVGTDIPADTTIASFGTYTVLAGTGTVILSQAATGDAGPETVTVTALPTVTYDSLRAAFVITSPTTGVNSSVGFATGTLATNLKFTSATGAVQSIGAAAATPASAMNGVVASTQNWATFTTVWEPDTATKLEFAAWVSGVSAAGQERFAYSGWDSDASPSAGSAPNSFGGEVITADYNGVMPVWDQTSGTKGAFLCGYAASIDWTERQGRATAAYKNQAGLVPDVTNATIASNLESNGYNFYGTYGTANDEFTFLQPGSMPGVWKWIDDYINQIWLNNAFQLALMSLLASAKSIPYNTQGYALIRAAMLDPINQAVNNGVIQPGIPLSASQAQQVNTAAGLVISNTLSQVGWYLQILQADAITRGNRGSPPITFWYTDGGSIQKINLASIDIQ